MAISPVPMDLVLLDGVPVNVTRVNHPDGSVSQHYSALPAPVGRIDSIGDPHVADIALVNLPGEAQARLTVQLPTGVGFEADGSAQPRAADNALAELIKLIDATSVPDSQRTQLHGAAQEFLNRAMASDAPVLLESVSTVGQASAADPASFAVLGQAGSAKTALLLDAQSLGASASVKLENIGFALVKGDVVVNASGPAMQLFGDAAGQHFKLGNGDDIVRGGAGDDILSGGGGNDQLYGDAGNDLLNGGMGDDRLDGGAGIDTAYFEGSRSDFAMRVVDGHLQLSMRAPSIGNTDMLYDTELLAFTAQGRSVPESIERLYEAVLGRDASAAEVAYWQEANEHGTYLQLIANTIAHSPEAGNMSNRDFIVSLYERSLDRVASQPELDYWVGRLDDGFSRGGVALGIVNSDEKLGLTSGIDIGSSEVGVLVRLYNTAFGRAPDAGGLNYWLSQLEQGVSIGDVADSFARVLVPNELPNAAANVVSDEAYINYLYQTGLHRAATPAETAQLSVLMKLGPIFDRGQVLLTIAESFESVQLVGAITSDIVTV